MRTLLIASMHRKEDALYPVLKDIEAFRLLIPDEFNTDVFGTFSGEVERIVNPLEAARLKCKAALERYPANVVIASEGSFGPHPDAPFITADEEWLVWMDIDKNIEVTARLVDTNTNFNAKTVSRLKELKSFASSVGFPSHALILKDKEKNSIFVKKGITNPSELEQVFEKMMKSSDSVYAETDMRALYNPSRMKVIEKAAQQLRQKLLSLCPQCQTPGFWIKEALSGLPCELCGMPTRSVKSLVYGCQKCDFTMEKGHPDGKLTENAMYCDFCNP
jgi:hypothetical protein